MLIGYIFYRQLCRYMNLLDYTKTSDIKTKMIDFADDALFLDTVHTCLFHTPTYIKNAYLYTFLNISLD